MSGIYKVIKPNWLTEIVLHIPGNETSMMAKEAVDKDLPGVFIETSTPFPCGSIVEFGMTVPGANSEILAKGIVRWTNHGERTDIKPGVGVDLLNVIEKTAKEAIKSYKTEETTMHKKS